MNHFLKIVVALTVSAFGSWLAAEAAYKLNGKANADIRSSLALNRIAAANERAADALERMNECYAHANFHAKEQATCSWLLNISAQVNK